MCLRDLELCGVSYGKMTSLIRPVIQCVFAQGVLFTRPIHGARYPIRLVQRDVNRSGLISMPITFKQAMLSQPVQSPLLLFGRMAKACQIAAGTQAYFSFERLLIGP